MDFKWYALSSVCHVLRYMSEMSFPIAGSHSDSVVVGGMFTCIAFLLPFTLAILLAGQKQMRVAVFFFSLGELNFVP